MNTKIKIDNTDLSTEDRFSRFKLIEWWDQDKLKNAKVLVIGAGALGNEILKNLSLLGVGNIFIADMDIIENSNLSRSILFRESDNGYSKAMVSAKAVKNIYPEINIEWFHGNIIYDLGMGVYRWADVVIAGLDNREARYEINKNCWRTNTPWIDGAIEQLNGIARAFIPPDGACYECTMGETDWKIFHERKSCKGLTRNEMLTGKVPTTPTSASIIAGIQCQEAVKFIHGLPVLDSRGYVFDGLNHNSYIINYQRNESCTSHETYITIDEIKISAEEMTLRELLFDVKRRLGKDAIIEFNNEIVESFYCGSCRKNELVFKSIGKISEKDIRCPSFNNERDINSIHSINGNENFLDKTFSEIGIPLFDIITGRENMNQIWLEFSKDAFKVLGLLFEN